MLITGTAGNGQGIIRVRISGGGKRMKKMIVILAAVVVLVIVSLIIGQASIRSSEKAIAQADAFIEEMEAGR